MAGPGNPPAANTCEKCGKPMTLFDGINWEHSHVIDFFICAEVKAVPGEDFATRMARRSREALETKDMGTT